jgi:hypothetical protein
MIPFCRDGARMHRYMKTLKSAALVLATAGVVAGVGMGLSSALAQNEPESNSADGVKIKLSGAFEKPGNYLVNKSPVYTQDIIQKTGTILLARKDVALVIANGERRTVDLTTKTPDDLLQGGEEVYLYERIIDTEKR